MDWYSRSFAQCAPWSYLLVVVQCMLLAMLLERAIFLLFRARLNASAFLFQIQKLVLAGHADRALKLTAAAGDAPVGLVCRVGLEAMGRGAFGLQDELDRAVAEQLPRLRYRLPKILLLAAVVGLLGVVGSVLLGVRGVVLGGDGPLPLGLAMEFAPALTGLVSAAAATIGWLTLSHLANQAAQQLEQCKQFMLDLAAQHRPGA